MSLSERQSQIIDAALDLIARGGIQNLTVKKIGNSLGITEPAVYRHFLNKAEIIKAMISCFDEAVPIGAGHLKGFDAIADFARKRFRQVAGKPALAHVMFSEEIFMDDPDFIGLLLDMMHRHKKSLEKHFNEARELGEINSQISVNTFFRLFFGPVRLLIRQWAMCNHKFDLLAEGDDLLDSLRLLLK